MRKWTVVMAFVAAVGVAGLVGGCQKSTPVESTQPGGAAVVTDHKVVPAEVGQDAVCPVMGTKLKVTADTLSAEYKGKVYYFCCPACPPAFKADPEKYTKTE